VVLVSIFEKGDQERNVIQITVLFFKKWVCLQKKSCFYSRIKITLNEIAFFSIKIFVNRVPFSNTKEKVIKKNNAGK